jgi:hypothetical protein
MAAPSGSWSRNSSHSPEKRADPVVYLASGPGDIAPLEVNGLIAANFIRDRDILVVSQRGTMLRSRHLPARLSTTSPEASRPSFLFRQ